MRYPFSRLTVLHGFFQDLNFHRLLAQKALKLPDLLQSSSKLRSRNDFLSSRNGGEAAFLILLLPLKQQAGLDTIGFAPIFPDICYHLTHYKPAAADIPVASDNPAHYADAIRYNARTPLQGSLLPLTRLVWA